MPYLFFRAMHYWIISTTLLVISFIKVSGIPQKFCGDNLSQILSQYCLSYNSPGHRVKRQIIKECCRNTCSIQYLLSNYCENYNREALERYLKEKNEIKKDLVMDNESAQSGSPERYVDRVDEYQQSTHRRNVLEKVDLTKNAAPEPKLGQIEDSQKPFYIFKHNIR